MTAVVTAGASGLGDDVALAVRPLSVVPDGEEFLVGEADSATYVVLPAIGLQVLELLRSGRTLREVSLEARSVIGQDVDVVDFARSLLDLGFATPAGTGPPAGAAEAEDGFPRNGPVWLRRVFSPVAWAGYGACGIAVAALLAISPSLFPHASDLFFLATPARSLAALTVIIYALAAAHEGCHWLAARAEGVRARIAVNRRLYFLVFEIDLTRLWSLPRRRRYSALLAGMAFDTVLLLVFLLARFGDANGWWRLSDGTKRVFAALTFVQVAAITSQFWIFVRTDVYALLVNATGCVNLFRVNTLMVRRALRLTTPEEEHELAESHPRDLAVARWYRFVYVLGLAAAAWFFIALFAPASVRLFGWLAGSIAHAGAGSERFWEALVFGGLIVSPQLLTLAVGLRDLRRWRTQGGRARRGARLLGLARRRARGLA
jgi:hypothetical protein